MSFIYIASSFSADTPEEEQRRYEEVFGFTGRCMQAGNVVYSPIVFDYNVAKQFNLPRSWERFWKLQSFGLMCKASGVWVLKNTGWRESEGVTAEIAMAHELNIPVCYFEMTERVPGE